LLARVLCLSCALALVACGDLDHGGPVEPPVQYDYFPLSVGSIMSYQRVGQLVTGGVQYTVSGTRVSSVVREVMHASGFRTFEVFATGQDTMFVDTTYIVGEPYSQTEYLYRSADSLLAYADTLTTTASWRIPLVLQVGDTWTYSSRPPSTGTVVSLEETVSVPAGVFEHCALLQIDYIAAQGSGHQVLLYVAPDLGLVTMHDTLEDTTGTESHMLVDDLVSY